MLKDKTQCVSDEADARDLLISSLALFHTCKVFFNYSCHLLKNFTSTLEHHQAQHLLLLYSVCATRKTGEIAQLCRLISEPVVVTLVVLMDFPNKYGTSQ